MPNVPVSQLQPGVFGVAHGGGVAGEIIRAATGSWAGHAFLYLGGGMALSGQPPKAVIVPATTWDDAIWAHAMWDQLRAAEGWTAAQVTAAQVKVVTRGHELEGCDYDFAAYGGFAVEVLHIRSEQQLAGIYARDPDRVCSALVDDAETRGGVPLDFVPSDGPGMFGNPVVKAVMPPNLVAPGMLLGLAQRLNWA